MIHFNTYIMDNMNHLKDLLQFDVRHLYSAEEQIIEALPKMIDNASNPGLKAALEQHLRVTQTQLERLNRIQQMLGASNSSDNDSGGLFSGLFGNSDKNLGVAGLITEGQKVMAVDMDPAVKDAAIIGCAQKIEHYEIAAYGTARTFAEQLGLTDVAQLLQQTLIEEHDTDDQLTSLAVRYVNQRAEAAPSSTRIS